jgi:hypothetical protein
VRAFPSTLTHRLVSRVLSVSSRRDANPRSTSCTSPPVLMLLRVRQGTSQQWTDPLAASRERSNSHELPVLQRASLSVDERCDPAGCPASGQGCARSVLKGGMLYTSQACVCESKAPPCGGAVCPEGKPLWVLVTVYTRRRRRARQLPSHSHSHSLSLSRPWTARRAAPPPQRPAAPRACSPRGRGCA